MRGRFLGRLHFMGRIQFGPNVSDTRIQASKYPKLPVRLGYVSAAYLWRIHVRYVSDTRYGPLVSAHHRPPPGLLFFSCSRLRALSLSNEKIGILPLWKVGFAQMPSILWASLKCLYETSPTRLMPFRGLSGL